MKTKKDFTKEVNNYAHYWNYERPHSGIEMNDHTPYEVVRQSKLLGTEKLLAFPTLILDDVVSKLKVCTQSVVVDAFLNEHPELMKKISVDPKIRRDVELRFFLPTNAQNVLTYYPKLFARLDKNFPAPNLQYLYFAGVFLKKTIIKRK